MATLYITEYARISHDNAGMAVLAGLEPSGANQTVAISGVSAQSAEITRPFVRLHTDTACCVKFGTDPTATTGDVRMAANQTEFFGAKPGLKIAVIAGV